MASCITFEDQLDDISNYLQWKVRMSVVLKENKIWNYVSYVVVDPTIDPFALDLHEVKEEKSQRIILDVVKDPLIPHISKKKATYEIWETLKNLFEAKNVNRKMALKDKLHDSKMDKGKDVSSYLTHLSQVKDNLVAVGEIISEAKLGRIALKGLKKEWDVFVKCVVGRENFLYWSRLWDNFTWEEIRMGSQRSGQKEDRVEENVALVAKGNKKRNSGRDLSKVRCYYCN
jgi:hypothetical protein